MSLYCSEYVLPYDFLLNKKNYAPYGSFYEESLKKLISCIHDCMYFGEKELSVNAKTIIQYVRLSVKGVNLPLTEMPKPLGVLRILLQTNQLFSSGA